MVWQVVLILSESIAGKRTKTESKKLDQSEAIVKQRKMDIVICVAALSDAGVSEGDLHEYLFQYWAVDERSKAKQYITEGRHVRWPVKKLENYLRDQKMNKAEIRNFLHDHNVEARLESDPTLCAFSGEKLKRLLEKD